MKKKNRKKIWIISITCIVLLGTAAAVFLRAMGRKPYKDLDAAQIAAAKVLLIPPDKAVEIEDIPELVDHLKNVVIYRRDDSYTEYAGQGVIFTLTMKDGTQTEVMEYNPFFVIDGVGYRTKYEPCQTLNQYANALLDSGTAKIILEEPPALAVVSDNTSFGAVLGAYAYLTPKGGTHEKEKPEENLDHIHHVHRFIRDCSRGLSEGNGEKAL